MESSIWQSQPVRRVAGSNGAVTILLGNGNGSFTQGTNLAFDGNASTIALADFNGDHKPDIAVSDAGNIFVFLGNGDGTFTLGYTNSNGGGNVLVAGDFNGDGKQDLVFADSNYIGLYLGDGQGRIRVSGGGSAGRRDFARGG
jgi:hypothetical protein